ncbi:MAG: hypothetical protein P8125_09620 [Gemmatimonadota bacterium]|jgi:hypothetical protein
MTKSSSIKSIPTIVLGLLCSGPAAGFAQEVEVPELSVGQVWEYATRPNESDSRVVICRLESDAKLGPIVHVQVRGVEIENPNAPSGVTDFIGHLPFSADSLQASLRQLETVEAQAPDCEEGYRTWREAFDAGQAGIFTVSVAEAVTFLERAFGG